MTRSVAVCAYPEWAVSTHKDRFQIGKYICSLGTDIRGQYEHTMNTRRPVGERRGGGGQGTTQGGAARWSPGVGDGGGADLRRCVLQRPKQFHTWTFIACCVRSRLPRSSRVRGLVVNLELPVARLGYVTNVPSTSSVPARRASKFFGVSFWNTRAVRRETTCLSSALNETGPVP